jgi:hypothetical protein
MDIDCDGIDYECKVGIPLVAVDLALKLPLIITGQLGRASTNRLWCTRSIRGTLGCDS